jgi:hypothetical protein
VNPSCGGGGSCFNKGEERRGGIQTEPDSLKQDSPTLTVLLLTGNK